MKWTFVDLTTLREIESGYEIHLEAGTWFHPKKLRSVAPEGINYSKKLSLLRKGIQHIKSIGNAKDESEKEKENAA